VDGRAGREAGRGDSDICRRSLRLDVSHGATIFHDSGGVAVRPPRLAA